VGCDVASAVVNDCLQRLIQPVEAAVKGHMGSKGAGSFRDIKAGDVLSLSVHRLLFTNCVSSFSLS
jgi:hypothetical protein